MIQNYFNTRAAAENFMNNNSDKVVEIYRAGFQWCVVTKD